MKWSMVVAVALSAGNASGQPTPVLSVVESFGAEPFSSVRGLQVTGDGRLLVSDQRENAVWLVDMRRNTRELVGREGSGPDEYKNPIRIMPFRGDSLLLEDLGNGRVAVLGPDFRTGRTIRMFDIAGTLIGGTDRRGWFYADGLSDVRRARAGDARAPERAPLFRIPREGGLRDTLAWLAMPDAVKPPVWPEWDAWAVGADGRVLVVRNQLQYRAEWLLPDGGRVIGGLLEGGRIKVSAEDQRIWSEGHPLGASGGVSSMNSGGAVRPLSPDFPETFPFVDIRNVFVDEEGRGWVGRLETQREKRTRFDVIGPDGSRVAQVRLPENRKVVGFGPGSLYAVYTDDLGFQWLERYATGSLGRR